jgi:hypothetical protein
MKKKDFNVAIAERVMGWDTKPSTMAGEVGYRYRISVDGVDYWERGYDFATDHNAAALVRARVREFRRISEFIDALTAVVGSDWQMVGAGYTDMWDLLSATPAQTARAAYLAVTGEELEAVDE